MNATEDMGKECWASGCEKDPEHLTLVNQTMVSLCSTHNQELNGETSK